MNRVSALWAWCARAVARLGGLSRRLFLRVVAAPGSWVHGSHSTWKGRLLFSPFTSPTRDYELYVPTAYSPEGSFPLVVMLHGCAQDPEGFSAATGMNRLADEHGFLTLYPRQGGKFNPYQCWNWFDVASQRGHGEAAIIAGMVSHVVDSYAVDPRRVYVVGMSSGGAMASILASCYAKLFAAAAIHSGLPYQAASTPWTAFRAMREGMHTPPEEAGRKAFRRSGLNGAAMPVVVLHGDADDVVHIVNAEQVIVQFAWMNHYSTNDGTAHPVLLAPARVTEARVLGGWRYTVKEYWRKGEVLLLLYVIEDMGHAWSGGDPGYRFNDPRGPDASRLIWEFFRRHRR